MIILSPKLTCFTFSVPLLSLNVKKKKKERKKIKAAYLSVLQVLEILSAEDSLSEFDCRMNFIVSL